MADEGAPNKPGDDFHLCGDCNKCGKKPAVTEITIKHGKKVETKLCEDCAKAQGVGMSSHKPIGQLVTSFVMAQSAARKPESQATVCESCGQTFADFRRTGLLGCQDCYKAFEKHLGPLVERAHDGGGHHVGKVPSRAGLSVERQERIAHLRRQLDEAVRAEEYERAAAVRDELHSIEQGGGPTAEA